MDFWKMTKVTAVVSPFLILLNGVLLTDSANEHVHFRIHIPQVIEHHIHTKTIFLHNLSKKKEPPIWSHDGTKKNGDEEWKSYWNSHFHRDHYTKNRFTSHEHSLRPPLGHRHATHSYVPQKETLRQAKEILKNELSASEESTVSYERGHGEGVHSERGHLYTDQYSKFDYDEDEEYEESNDENDEGNEDTVTTNAGRYFLDELEEEKAESDRRSEMKSEKIR